MIKLVMQFHSKTRKRNIILIRQTMNLNHYLREFELTSLSSSTNRTSKRITRTRKRTKLDFLHIASTSSLDHLGTATVFQKKIKLVPQHSWLEFHETMVPRSFTTRIRTDYYSTALKSFFLNIKRTCLDSILEEAAIETTEKGFAFFLIHLEPKQ